MATRAIVPREDGEGSLGIETKRWGNIQTKKINGVSIAESGTATTSAAGLVELATNAEVQTGTDATSAVTPASLKAYTEWRPSGMKNLIINGNFDIWQRGNGPFTTTGGTHLFSTDQFYVLCAGGTGTASCSVSRTSDVPEGIGAESSLEVSWSGIGGHDCMLGQKIERKANTINQALTLSFWARRTDSASTVTAVLCINGSNDGNITITNEWARYCKSIVPADYDLPLDIQLLRFMSEDATIRIAQVQLELGPFATPFEQRPIGLELALCQRYYQKRAMYVGATPSSMRIDMRAAPTITGGGTGFSSTGTTADTLICSQTTGAVETLEMAAEL